MDVIYKFEMALMNSYLLLLLTALPLNPFAQPWKYSETAKTSPLLQSVPKAWCKERILPPPPPSFLHEPENSGIGAVFSIWHKVTGPSLPSSLKLFPPSSHILHFGKASRCRQLPKRFIVAVDYLWTPVVVSLCPYWL